MKSIKFSVITPVWASNEEKVLQLLRAIESVKNQTYDKSNIEHIIVNDGSLVDIRVPDYPWIKVINQENLQRIQARNSGLKKAKGEWISFLDSDDEYRSDYLSKVNSESEKYPQYKIFNFGCQYISQDGGFSIRSAFRPREEEVGHESFAGGNIVQGTYVFKRDIYKELGGFPKLHLKNMDCTVLNYPAYPDQKEPFIRDLWMLSPYDFSAAAQLEFPEIQRYFMEKHPDHPKKLVKELGNPFGDDYYLFYKYTRKYHSKPIDENLYIVHSH